MLAKKFALGFGIAVILPLMVHYGVSTFSGAPPWGANYYYDSYSYQQYKDATPEEKARIDNEKQEKHKAWRAKQARFQRHLFFVAVPVGIACIIIGALISIQAVGTGLMFGGIFCVTEGYMMYWSELQDGLRFLSLLAAFLVLIIIGYRKLAK